MSSSRSGHPGRLISLAGPVSFAAANFFLTFLLQQTASPDTFGLFAFSQVAIASGMGLSNGLFGTPLLVAIAKHPTEEVGLLGSFSRANIVFSVISVTLLAVVCMIIGAGLEMVASVGALAMLMWMRWFVRSAASALSEKSSVSLSDAFYGFTAALGAILLFALKSDQIEHFFGVQCVACLSAFYPIRRLAWRSATSSVLSSDAIFRSVFAKHGVWSTLVVIGAEMVTNCHAFAIIIIWGPAAYAPLALASLLFRPVGVILTSLIVFERPKMARQIIAHDYMSLSEDVRFIHLAVGGTWVANVALIGAIIQWFPGLVDTREYGHADVLIALILTGLLVFVKAAREPLMASLQAGGESKSVAQLSLFSAAITSISVAFAIALFPSNPSLSLMGAIAGELVQLVSFKLLFANKYATVNRSLR